MPVTRPDVLGSTLQNTTHRYHDNNVHKGPNQAGNKSLLSYRAGTGIPGYTGYIPTTNQLVLPVKAADHTGRPATTASAAALTANTVNNHKVTEYGATMVLQPDQTRPTDRTGGGYWVADRKQPANIPFTATTTYQREVLDSANTAAATLSRVDGVVSTLAQYEPARVANDTRKRSMSVDPSAMRTIPRTAGLPANTVSASLMSATGRHASPAGAAAYTQTLVRPHTQPTSQGELPGYQTSYNAMTDRRARQFEVALETRQPHSAGGDPRFATLPRVMVPSMQGAYSTYGQDYGVESSDPMDRQPENKSMQTRTSTTRDLADGTTRNVAHIPRYTGHIPASRFNTAEALQQGAGLQTRPDHKANSLLFTLDQYSRTRLPGNTTFKPQETRNTTTVMPSKGPTDLTISGLAGKESMRFGMPQMAHTYHNNSKTGIMSFFANSDVGTEFVSDNGLANAQVYYKTTRPREGAPVTAIPSMVTYYGAPFKATNSIV